MALKLLLPGKKQASVISSYAPSLTNPDDAKEKFYKDLHRLVSSTLQSENLIILVDFNAQVGTDFYAWEGVIGRHGIGKCKPNDLLLKQFCTEHELIITNTTFCLPARTKTSWMHPLSKLWHLIDFVIVRKRDKADCWTDHRLIISRMNLRILPKR